MYQEFLCNDSREECIKSIFLWNVSREECIKSIFLCNDSREEDQEYLPVERFQRRMYQDYLPVERFKRRMYQEFLCNDSREECIKNSCVTIQEKNISRVSSCGTNHLLNCLNTLLELFHRNVTLSSLKQPISSKKDRMSSWTKMSSLVESFFEDKVPPI
jgi:hypothetical protein